MQKQEKVTQLFKYTFRTSFVKKLYFIKLYFTLFSYVKKE